MLTDGELTSMRATLEESLAGTAIVQSGTAVSDGGGGGSIDWVASGTVPCRLMPIVSKSLEEGNEGERITEDGRYIATLPWDSGVTTEDRLSIDGDIYNVTAIRDLTWNLGLRADIRKKT